MLPYLFATAAKLSQLRRGDAALRDRLEDVAQWVDRSREMARDLMNSVSYPPEVLEDPLRAAREFINDVVLVGVETPRVEWPCLGRKAKNSPDGVSDGACGESLTKESDVNEHPGLASMLAGELTESVSIMLYRAVCELVRNAVRHADATLVTVSCDRLDESGWAESVEPSRPRFRVEVRDNGCGMRTKGNADSGRHGLDWLRSRTAMVQWELHFHSEPGVGTKVTLDGTGDCVRRAPWLDNDAR